MVQIRQLQRKAPANLKFWGRVKLRVGRRRHLLRGSSNNPARIFRDLKKADRRDGILLGLRRRYTRSGIRIQVPTRKWDFTSPGRWIHLAHKKFRQNETDQGKWLANAKKRVKVNRIEPLATGAYLQRGHFGGGIWGKEEVRGRAYSANCIHGKGSQTFNLQLIEDLGCEDDQKVDISRRDSNVGVEFCGCTGGMLWKPRDKIRLLAKEVVRADDQNQEIVLKSREDDQAVLPDDIVEMCLARTSFISLLRARAVCKKWRSLASSTHFFQLRESIRTMDPWLFLFGLSRNGVCVGEIHALDPSSSKWHTIKADLLTGRMSYSLTAVKSCVYVVGGYASTLSIPSSRNDKESLKTQKTVLMYSPLTGSWRKLCPLTTERAAPIVAIFDLKTSGSLVRERGRQASRHSMGKCNLSWSPDTDIDLDISGDRKFYERGSRIGGELAVYGGTETQGKGFKSLLRTRSIRRLDVSSAEDSNHQEEPLRTLEADFKMLDVQGRGGGARGQQKFGIIVVGGQGAWNEQLDSGEMYDPVTDRWREIRNLPGDHGNPCAGVVCQNHFYVCSESNKLAAYDLKNDTWQSIQVSQSPACLLDYSPNLISCQGRIFLLGVTWGPVSENGLEKATRMIWELTQDPFATGWINVSQHPDAPLDWNAIFVADEDIIFGVEMFKIFGQLLDFVTVCKISKSGSMAWERGSRMQIRMQEMDPSSCLTKTAVVVRL